MRTVVVRVVLPGVLVIGLIILDLFRILGFFRIKAVQNGLHSIRRPFSQFLHYEDLAEFDGSKAAQVVQPRWKLSAIGVLCAISTITWFYDAAYAIGLGYPTNINAKEIWTAGGVAICWVSQ